MDSSQTTQQNQQSDGHPSRWPARLDILLFAVVASAAVYVFCLLSYSLYFQVHTYSNAIQAALRDPNRGDEIALAYARATDFAIVKTSAVFLGFIMALLGALYVLRAATAAFKFSGSTAHSSASLQTSSPGLVMMALGVVTINCALFARTSVGLDDAENDKRGKIQIAATGTPTPAPEKSGAQPSQGSSSPARKANESQAELKEFPPFMVGSAELSEKQKKFLIDLRDKIATTHDTVQIEAKGDDKEPVEYSLALAERRADAIKQFLAQPALAEYQVKFTSYGKSPPGATNSTKLQISPKK